MLHLFEILNSIFNIIMAYALLTSLLNTIEFNFLHQPHLPGVIVYYDKEIIETLCKKIRFLQDFLEESEKNNINNDARRVLETNIRVVAQDAEAKIESELHQHYSNIGVVDDYYGPFFRFPAWKQIKLHIESIEWRIHSVEPQRRIAIENIKVGNSFSQHSSEPCKNVMVGCEDEFDTIMHNLLSASKELEVISIVGMGGIGKTTLVKRVYEDATIISHFDVRAWATVSQDHNLREMLVSLLASNNVITNGVGNDLLANQLRQQLMGQRYLIVLDDTWSTEAWDDIHRCFPQEDLNGSRILLTTRLKQVADYASSSGNNNPHHMRFLSPTESWNLFYQKVFEEKKFSLEFETVGRGIVKKCHGLPLTIIVVAGLLTSFNNPSLTQWENIAENLTSFLNTDPEEKCSQILSLSYHHLPLHLKVCFLYFGVFPEDSTIHVKKLFSLWIAEGFINLEFKNTMDENLELKNSMELRVGETYRQWRSQKNI